MAEPFIGQITMMGFNFAPRNWAECDGQLIAVSQNPSLFALLGTTYGGNGHIDFGVPDMRGRTPINPGELPGFLFERGEKGGFETVTLDMETLPQHTHLINAANEPGDTRAPNDVRLLAQTPDIYRDATNLVEMNTNAVSLSNGGTVGHENMQPSIVVNFCISLLGLFPSHS